MKQTFVSSVSACCLTCLHVVRLTDCRPREEALPTFAERACPDSNSPEDSSTSCHSSCGSSPFPDCRRHQDRSKRRSERTSGRMETAHGLVPLFSECWSGRRREIRCVVAFHPRLFESRCKRVNKPRRRTKKPSSLVLQHKFDISVLFFFVTSEGQERYFLR